MRALGGGNVVAGAGVAPPDAGGHGFDELEFDRYTEFHLLTRELTETASDIATIGARVAGTIGDFDSDLTRLGRLTREVQDKTMEFRMVPLGTLTTRLERAVRSTGRELRQADRLRHRGRARGAGQVAAASRWPIRCCTCCATPSITASSRSERRLAAGKPERGQITVRAFHEGTDVLIEVQDDGGGLDLERIRRTAVDAGTRHRGGWRRR